MPIRRLAPVLVVAAVACLAPAAVAAHAELVGSEPAAGAALESPPEQVVLTFDAELDPDRSSVTVTDPQGDESGNGGVDLTVPERNVLRAQLTADLAGRYEVSWTAAAGDGHAASGSHAFVVTDGESAAPNTAVRPPSVAARVGVVLVLLAGLIVLGKRTARPLP
jgi:methionine-rich copper-binding protein CopC